MRIYILMACYTIASCANNTSNKPVNKDTLASSQTVHAGSKSPAGFSQPIMEAGCYQQILKKDTADLRLEVKDSTVNGYLRYNRFGKDGNVGTLKGVIRDSLLLVAYRFRSEGMSSVREIIFKIKPGQLLEATGPRDERTGENIYVNKNQLQYTVLPPFIKVNCSKINEIK